MSSPIRCILFDAVGTLIHPHPPVAEVYHSAARQFGSRLSAAEIGARFREAFAESQNGQATFRDVSASSQLFRPPTSEPDERDRWRRIVRQVIDDVQAKADYLFDCLWNHFADPRHWRVFDDVAPALGQLADRGFQLGIASNFDRRLHAIAAEHSTLANCEPVFVSSEVGFSKPDPRFFAAVAGKLSVPPNQILLVGDDELSDIHGARAAGWHAILLSRQSASPVSPSIRSLADLPSILPQ